MILGRLKKSRDSILEKYYSSSGIFEVDLKSNLYSLSGMIIRMDFQLLETLVRNIISLPGFFEVRDCEQWKV